MNLVTITESVKASSTEKKPEAKHKFVPYSNSNKQKVSDAIVVKLRGAIAKIKKLTGKDLGTLFGDTVRGISSTTSKKGADTVSWHKTGRAVDFNQGAGWLILEDKDEDSGKMMFRLYFKLKSGLVLTSDKDDDENLVDDDDKGYVVQLKKSEGHTIHFKAFTNFYDVNLVDVTKILDDYDFKRIPAQDGWKTVYNKREWWHYEKRDGLTMYGALLEIYTEEKIRDSYKGLMATLSGRNHYGPRLMREGWLHWHIDQYVDPYPATGNVGLWFPIGNGGKSTANHPWDCWRLNYRLMDLGYYDEGKWRGGIKMAPEIKLFQKTVGKTEDGWMSVGGGTHNELVSVFANKVNKGSHNTLLYGNVGDGERNFPADVKMVITSLNIGYNAGLCNAFMTSEFTVTTEFTTALENLIKGFQQHIVGMTTPDGEISKGGNSHTKLADLVDTATP